MQTTRRSRSPNGRSRKACRRCVDRATNRRDTALLDVPCSDTSAGTGSSVLAYRRVDTPAATAASVCSSSGFGGRCPFDGHQRHFVLGAAHPQPRRPDLPSPEHDLTVRAPAAPRGPLDLVAPLRATQNFPLRLHHRLQDRIPVAMHKPWNASRTPFTTPSTGNGT